MRSKRTLAAAVLLLLATGCANTADGRRPAPSSADAHAPALRGVKQISTNQQVVETPFNAVFESMAERSRSYDAMDRLVSRCTLRFGSPLVPGENTFPERNESFFDLPMPYGPVDKSRASRFAYHDPLQFAGPVLPTWDGAETPAGILTGRGAKSDARDSAGKPVPDGGCIGEARRDLGGARPQRALEVAHAAYARYGADPRGAAAVRAWVKCMKAKGYKYGSPLDPVDEFAGQPGSPSNVEVATVMDDIACKRSTREIDILIGLSVAYQQQAIDENQEAFAEYRQWKTKHLALVAEALATAPAPANRHTFEEIGPDKVTGS